jgi:putative copper resistance protein D
VSPSVWDAAVIAGKSITYAATLGAAGAVFFLRVCGAFVPGAERLSIRHIVRSMAVVSVLAGGAQILATAGTMSGDAAGMLDGSLINMVWQTGAGRANAIRAIGLALAALTVLSARASGLALLGAVMAATSFAWTGHARILHADALPIVLLAVHLLGVAFWVGALLPLLVVSRSGDVPRIAGAAACFGRAAIFVVAGMMAAGIGLLWMMLGGVAQLWGSAYGRFVLLKLSFVAGLLCMAAFNKLQLTPRLLAGDVRAVRSLRASIRLELFLAALILAVTATFTTVAGPPALN